MAKSWMMETPSPSPTEAAFQVMPASALTNTPNRVAAINRFTLPGSISSLRIPPERAGGRVSGRQVRAWSMETKSPSPAVA